MLMKSVDSLQELALSYHVGPRDCIQVIKFRDKVPFFLTLPSNEVSTS